MFTGGPVVETVFCRGHAIYPLIEEVSHNERGRKKKRGKNHIKIMQFLKYEDCIIKHR